MDQFERAITNAVLQQDGTAVVTYSCGHTAIWIIPPSAFQNTGQCSVCINEAIDRWKRERRAEREKQA